ncbi:ribonuclease Z [Companilactobacillus sp. RD055328]|uniref:ribonuclease Z n=1 Tax=Companilactobacillus sp. RD055328 TaxID=2916634 RepID=UPI001FC7FC9F|nr:ribonuclease Z [Companilactobacillus sp. RD055328]GKQ42766.1 ribonuclease Z [Companilactobacillus sp. RD055328]
MELEFLGTGAGVPSKGRNVSSVALKLLEERKEVWLFDAGEATQHQILRTNIRPRKITKIFISHLHGDHIFGLPGFLSSRANQGGNSPLTIYGPKGIEQFVKTSLKISESHLNYKIYYEEITDGKTLLDDSTFTVTAKLLDHRIDCFGFRVVEKDHPGELLVDKLQEMQIPSGPIYGRIKRGEEVTLDDGRVVNGKDFIGEAKKGRIVAVISDTRFTPMAADLVKDADVLVHESTFSASEAKLAKNYYHSTSLQAAKLAEENGVKKLFLTHISARYAGKNALILQDEARKVFENTKVVRDFYEYSIPFVKE